MGIIAGCLSESFHREFPGLPSFAGRMLISELSRRNFDVMGKGENNGEIF